MHARSRRFGICSPRFHSHRRSRSKATKRYRADRVFVVFGVSVSCVLLLVILFTHRVGEQPPKCLPSSPSQLTVGVVIQYVSRRAPLSHAPQRTNSLFRLFALETCPATFENRMSTIYQMILMKLPCRGRSCFSSCFFFFEVIFSVIISNDVATCRAHNLLGRLEPSQISGRIALATPNGLLKRPTEPS